MKLSHPNRQWWTVAQIVAELGASRTTVYDLIANGELPAIRLSNKPGAGLRVHRDDLGVFIDRRRAKMEAEVYGL